MGGQSAGLQSWTDEGPPVTPSGPELEFLFPTVRGERFYYRARVDFQFP